MYEKVSQAKVGYILVRLLSKISFYRQKGTQVFMRRIAYETNWKLLLNYIKCNACFYTDISVSRLTMPPEKWKLNGVNSLQQSIDFSTGKIIF